MNNHSITALINVVFKGQFLPGGHCSTLLIEQASAIQRDLAHLDGCPPQTLDGSGTSGWDGFFRKSLLNLQPVCGGNGIYGEIPATLVIGILYLVKEAGHGFNELNPKNVIRGGVSGIISLVRPGSGRGPAVEQLKDRGNWLTYNSPHRDSGGGSGVGGPKSVFLNRSKVLCMLTTTQDTEWDRPRRNATKSRLTKQPSCSGNWGTLNLQLAQAHK